MAALLAWGNACDSTGTVAFDGGLDASVQDAGEQDAGEQDAGEQDAGLQDAAVNDAGVDAGTDGGDRPGDQDPAAPFSFVVFGDLNGGGCAKNERLHRLVADMLQTDASFFVQTGDVIDGYGDTSCFGDEPGACPCNGESESANMRQQLLPLMEAGTPAGMQASYYQVMGNHDGNWGSDWYPDPCGGGICDLLGLDNAGIAATYINHGPTLDAPGFFPHQLSHGDICALSQDQSGHPGDFFYSFSHGNSLFIVLALMEDYYGMLNCNGHPGYDSCEDYCTDLSLLEDSTRANNCYSVYQYDWLVHELQTAGAEHENIFVFAHAPLLGSGDNHGPTAGAEYYRSLLEAHNVKLYLNGHNHAYERSHAVRGNEQDPNGTMYITVGSGGALTDGNSTDWYTARSYQDWTTYGDYEQMTTYLKISVDGASITGEVVTLAGNSVDQFSR